jgi:hypothetical protein
MAYHQYETQLHNSNRFDYLQFAARNYACTREGQKHIRLDLKTLMEQGRVEASQMLENELNSGVLILKKKSEYLHSRADGVNREITRIWTRSVQTDEDMFFLYLTLIAGETGKNSQQLMSYIKSKIGTLPLMDSHHPDAVRFITWDKGQPVGTPIHPINLTAMFHLENLAAQARQNSRLVAQIPDPDGGVWLDYQLITGRNIAYNMHRQEFLLPEVDPDVPPRLFSNVDKSLADAITSARRPGLLVAAIFFRIEGNSLHGKNIHDFYFAHLLSNNVYPLSHTPAGPAPEQILPEPIQRSLRQGLL